MAHSVRTLTNLADLVLRLGTVERATCHPNGASETVTTHTVMVALLALSLAELGGVPAPDALSLALSYALVHDLPEALAGDTDTSITLDAEAQAEKVAREDAARDTIYTLLGPSPVSAALAAVSDPSPGPRRGQILRAYTHGSTSRTSKADRVDRQIPQTEIVDYVWAVDKIAPMLVHCLDEGRGAEARGRTPDDIAATCADLHTKMQGRAPRLAELYAEIVQRCLTAYRARLSQPAPPAGRTPPPAPSEAAYVRALARADARVEIAQARMTALFGALLAVRGPLEAPTLASAPVADGSALLELGLAAGDANFWERRCANTAVGFSIAEAFAIAPRTVEESTAAMAALWPQTEEAAEGPSGESTWEDAATAMAATVMDRARQDGEEVAIWDPAGPIFVGFPNREVAADDAAVRLLPGHCMLSVGSLLRLRAAAYSAGAARATTRALVRDLGGVGAVRDALAAARASLASARADADANAGPGPGEAVALERATAPVLRAGVAVYADVVQDGDE